MRTFIFILFLFLFQNCDLRIDRVNRWYELENGTGHKVKIEFYAHDFHIPHTDSLSGPGIIFRGLSSNDVGDNISAGAALGADSIVVTYDDTKRQIYYYSNVEYELKTIPQVSENILNDAAYQALNNELYRYTFTEQDYENAELIEE